MAVDPRHEGEDLRLAGERRFLEPLPNMVPLDQMAEMLKRLKALDEVTKG
ncbi:hypothetical protein [Jiella avicenniae]|uniref:Uncharacterized protein n=1 Tax=Jiella avicenniae TaxID=2907202 RepID=A0A9X1P0Y6_9HYPH|nr:hypothetical protein [Jiella avicenniae]MCE7027784.1 hypothetical protein [Jiella avicenniae]